MGGSCNAEKRTLLYVTHRGATRDTCIRDMRVNEKYINGVIYIYQKLALFLLQEVI